MTDEEKMKFLERMVTAGHTSIGQLIMDNHGTMNISNQQGVQRHEENAPEKISLEVMGRAIKAVQGMFWGKSSYAVIFCAVRDFYGHADNGTLFEDEVSGLYSEMGLDYDCPENTIASTFYNNSYLKLPIKKWKENNVKLRSLQLVNAFKNAVEEQIAKK